jgi:hypothetical protein
MLVADEALQVSRYSGVLCTSNNPPYLVPAYVYFTSGIGPNGPGPG